MADKDKTLSALEAQAYYNWFGKKQDSQGFYENPALDDLIAHANFQNARMVFEFGCGTGKFAERLLNEFLPSSASYICCDFSPIMVGLTKKRLDKHSKLVKVRQSDGIVYFPQPDHSANRVIASYVLDLLSDGDIKSFFYEAHRVLIRGGMGLFGEPDKWDHLAVKDRVVTLDCSIQFPSNHSRRLQSYYL